MNIDPNIHQEIKYQTTENYYVMKRKYNMKNYENAVLGKGDHIKSTHYMRILP